MTSSAASLRAAASVCRGRGDIMDFRPTELQQLLQNNAQEFLEREATLDQVRVMEAEGSPDARLWSQIAELGWLGLPLAEEFGGQGASLLDTSVLLNEVCRAALPVPFQPTLLAALTIQRFGDAALKQQFLPQIANGTSVSVAFLEASDDLHAPFAARYQAGSVTGEKRFVEYANSTDLHLVAATENGAPGLALVRRNGPAVQVRATPSIGGVPSGFVSYNGAAAEGWIAGQEAVDYLRDLGTALTAFESYSYAQKSLDMTVDYVQMRVQFGQPIGAFQAVQNRIADIAILVEASRFLTHELLWQFDNGVATPEQVAVVKAITAQAGPQVAMDCHLLHGGIGYMQEYNLQFFTRRGKDASLRWGTTREMANRVADAAFA